MGSVGLRRGCDIRSVIGSNKNHHEIGIGVRAMRGMWIYQSAVEVSLRPVGMEMGNFDLALDV